MAIDPPTVKAILVYKRDEFQFGGGQSNQWWWGRAGWWTMVVVRELEQQMDAKSVIIDAVSVW